MFAGKKRVGNGPWWIGALKLLMVIALVVMSGLVATEARAAEDVVHFGNSIRVDQNQSIHDAVCFFCSVTVDGTVKGDIVVFFGSVHVNGHASHDVVNFFGQVRAADNASIGHDLVNFFGSVQLGENATVGEDAVVMFGRLYRAQTASIAGSEVSQPPLLFWGPFLLIVGFVVLMKEIFGSRRRRLLRGY